MYYQFLQVLCRRNWRNDTRTCNSSIPGAYGITSAPLMVHSHVEMYWYRATWWKIDTGYMQRDILIAMFKLLCQHCNQERMDVCECEQNRHDSAREGAAKVAEKESHQHSTKEEFFDDRCHNTRASERPKFVPHAVRKKKDEYFGWSASSRLRRMHIPGGAHSS
ncbi:hypothetical protein TGME49_250100 [Toxoplasma gondii ME49]|uniref:Uncharacterized protein n=4 Tax=Toxoplasma gondii TaxID=5811 RepID=A0A125YKN8_TOXGV|nr:hypothetical protein TGME49_250100 [Toxoplasma gondii ME49]EPT25165.1 hypothetical protein TGME49_250100 [Toxoplasma gondii ME49]ESS34449.1 hypothetical protein TGVEG_250100 [Toxoplasma gondii VEG]KYF50164.1 hypothetical protein TGARI_250100 [Toxoplasma gondii ARI]PIM04381.1 hypothetical protein TGCOUG_250100 [Toxoplasma gondii COUG]|eukprot:XP_018635062.1 hypothetical protein TGME49_250100 [Toxoplasma gondii ME49]